MAARYGLTDEEVAAGYVLTCQSVPDGDGVAVDYDRLNYALNARPCWRNHQGQGPCRPSAREQRFAARADRAGQCRPAIRQDRRRRRGVPRRGRQYADPQGDEGGRAAAARYARRPRPISAAPATSVSPSCCGRSCLANMPTDERIAGLADSGRLRRAAPWVRAGRDRQPQRQGAARHAELAQPSRSFTRSAWRVVEYPYYERGQAAIRFEDMLAELSKGGRGDVALLHGCCHNPTGADLNPIQWARGHRCLPRARADPVRRHRLPGVWARARRGCGRPARILSQCDEVIMAQSCDKNFSCYRDRVGSLFVKTGSVEATAEGDGPCVPAGARDVVDAARSWRRLRRISSSTIPSFAPAGWSS